jgi:hypothetical protein
MNIKGKVDFLKTIKLSENFNETKLHIPSDSSSTVNLLNFKNEDDYGIYVVSTGISNRGNTLDFKARDYNNITIHDLLTLRPEGNVGIGTTNPTEYLSITGNNSGNITSLGLRNGNGSIIFNNGAQIAFGFNGLNQYQHFIHTRHNDGNNNNAIDFYTSDGTQNNTVISGSIHTMSLVSGNVGIGTTNPTKLLTLGNNTINNSVVDKIEIESYFNTGGSGGAISFKNRLNYSPEQEYICARIKSISNAAGDGSVDGENYYSGHLIFETQFGDNSNTNSVNRNTTERMRITNRGNVGIGTTNPLTKLQIDKPVNSSLDNIQNYHLLLGGYNHGDNTYRAIGYGYTVSSTHHPPAYTGFKTSSNSSYTKGHLVFGTRNSTSGSTAPSERMRITDTGNVGIGTTNPSAKLDVSGELKIRGTNRHTHICYSDGNTYIRGSTNSGHVYLNDNGGNVGIGVTNPTYKLQVNGNTYSNLLYGLNIQNSNGIIGNTLTFNRNQLDISVGNVGYLHYMENNPTNGFGFTDNHKRSTNTYGRYIRFWIKGASNGHTIYLQGFANWYYNGNNQLKFMNGTTLTNSTSDCISNTYVEGNKGQRWMVTPWYDTNSVGGDGFRLGIKNIQGSTFYMTQVVLEFTKNSTGLS